jgi:hypothetical protein
MFDDLPFGLPLCAIVMVWTCDHLAQCKVEVVKSGGYSRCWYHYVTWRWHARFGNKGLVEYRDNRKHRRHPFAMRCLKDMAFALKQWQELPIGKERDEVGCDVATPLWGKCEDETHTPKSGNLESSGTPATSELDNKEKNTLPWGNLYTVGKALKFRCRKWPCMSHLDIHSTSYGQKKGRESNWQFDSRLQKVGNRPNPGMWR